MKRSFLLLVSLLLMSYAYSQTVAEIYQNDFDSYTPGDYLGVVDPDNWLPWGGTPGASDDAVVSDDQSNSAPNSFVVSEDGGATDIVWKLGDKITGQYLVGWWMYVPADFEGYYNFQKTESPGTEWAFEIYFRTDGTVEFQVEQTTVATTTYTPDTWFYMDHSINLDTDEAEIFLDGTSFYTWQWSNGGLLQLGGVDFYAATNVAYYVDDVLYEQIFDPIYCDGFEDYMVGDYISEQNPDFWSTWSGTPGGAEDGIISDAQAYAGSNSLLIEDDGGATDVVLKLGDRVSGAYQVNWYMYVPTGGNAYYNFQKTELPGTEWACDIFFYDDGTGEFQIDQATLTTFNYAPDTWLFLDHIIDLDKDSAMFYIDGTLIYEWQWSNGGLLQLGGVDFYNIDATYINYMDDLCYLQTGGSTDPAIAVTPETIEANVVEGFTGEETLNVENVGAAALDYELAIVYDLGTKREALPLINKFSNVAPDQYAETKTNSGGQAPPTDEEVLTYCDENSGSAIGLTTAGVEWEVAAKWPASEMNQFAGMELTSVLVYINEVNPDDEFTLRVFGMELPGKPGDLLHEQTFTPLAASWNEITLTTPVVCTGEDLWVGYLMFQSLESYPAGAGCEPANLNGDWIRSGPSWGHLSDNPELPYNWNIVAYLNGEPITQWLSADPMMGSVAPAVMDDVTVMFDATTLATGAYNAEIVVFSNDPENKSVTVPVTMNVNPISINEIPADEAFVVFPNPAQDFVTVQANGTIHQVKIYNYVGQLIDQVVVSNDKATLSTDGYQQGIYFIHVETAEGWSTRKIVIE